MPRPNPKSIASYAPDRQPGDQVYNLTETVADDFGTRHSLRLTAGIFVFVAVAVTSGVFLGDNFDSSALSLAFIFFLVALVTAFNYVYIRSGRRTFYRHIQYRITTDGIAQEFPAGGFVPGGRSLVQRQARLREQYILFAEIAAIRVTERELVIKNGRSIWSGGAKEIMIPRGISGYQEIVGVLGRRAETKFTEEER